MKLRGRFDFSGSLHRRRPVRYFHDISLVRRVLRNTCLVCRSLTNEQEIAWQESIHDSMILLQPWISFRDRHARRRQRRQHMCHLYFKISMILLHYDMLLEAHLSSTIRVKKNTFVCSCFFSSTGPHSRNVTSQSQPRQRQSGSDEPDPRAP